MKALGAYIFAGGFTIGVKRHFDVIAHLEGDGGYGVDTAKLNWPDLEVRYGPSRWHAEDFKGVDFVFANPPCAIFSTMGILTTRGADSWRTDPRLDCWKQSFGLLELLQPRAWALESVPPAYTRGREFIDELTKRALILGYSVTHLLVNAKWYGIPQKRKRFFLVCHRPAMMTGWQLNWAPAPTVRETLAEVTEPGSVIPLDRADITAALRATPAGIRLCDAWEDQHPGYNERRNSQGKVVGRPSFQDCRLPLDEPMNVFAGGEKLFHPTEDRRIGIEEAKAVCGYPPEFRLAGSPSSWSSLLARAVMPPVGEWLARTLKATLAGPDVMVKEDRRVTFLDLSEPERVARDLTSDYLDANGRVFMRIRAAVNVDVDVDVEEEEEDEPTQPRRSQRPVLPPAVVIDLGTSTDDPMPAEGEGSGQFIQRMYLTDRYTPDELVALVHARFPNRTTRRSDVYYNYRKLLDGGVPNVPKWSLKRQPTPEPTPVSTVAVPALIPKAEPTPTVTVSPSTKPRILLTGFTPMHVGSKLIRMNISRSSSALESALIAMGFDVDRRRVSLGEDVSSYVKCVVFISSPMQIVSIKNNLAYGALWVLRERSDSIVAVDDDAMRDMMGHFQSMARSEERAFRFFEEFYGKENDIYRPAIFEMIKKLAFDRWSWPVLTPLQGKGDPFLLKLPADLIEWEPSSFAYHYETVPTERERTWVSASLTRGTLPSTAWVIRVFGNAGNGKGVRISEREVTEHYAKSWGVLSLPNEHPGSSWWRARFYLAAEAGAVMSACVAEAKCLGEPYVQASNVRNVERMTDAGLTLLAERQRDALAEVTWSKERVINALWPLFDAAQNIAEIRVSLPPEEPQSPPTPEPTPVAIVEPDGEPTPMAGEGSGRFIQRVWMLGTHTPDELVALVHRRYAGRTTRRGDVYYNYRKLLDAGTPEVPPWSPLAARAVRPAVPNAEIALRPLARPQGDLDQRPRFLVTGTTPIQVGSERTELKIVTSTRAMVAALDDLGYNVDWRPVTPGEDLTAYDGCLVYLQKSNSIASRYFYGAVWTILARPDSILGVDDWQTSTILAGFKTFARSETRAFRLFDRTGSAEFTKHKDAMYRCVCDYAVNLPWPQPVIAPLFDGGDARKLELPAMVVPIDPTIYAPRYPVVELPRERRWVQASLLLKDPPRTEWPTLFFGNAGTGYGGVGKSTLRDAQSRVTEAELMSVYCGSWGVLSPAHANIGSGWWRVRYLMAADAGCVLSADLGEAQVLGEEYAFASNVRAIERLSDAELGEVAYNQARRLREIAWSKDRVLETLSNLIRSRHESSNRRDELPSEVSDGLRWAAASAGS